MIHIIPAQAKHVKAIEQVCADSYRTTYKQTHSSAYIERMIRDYYNADLIHSELTPNPAEGWDGWYVAVEQDQVVGAAAGGMISHIEGEVYVLYLDPLRKREGIGSKLLTTLTQIQKEQGAQKQWVSVFHNNQMAIPFYQAQGFVSQYEERSYNDNTAETYITLRCMRRI